MSRSKLLYKLQQIDSRIDRAQKRIQEIHDILNDRRSIIKARKTEEAARQVLSEKQKELRKAEYEVEDQQAQLEATRKKLYSGAVKNPKELEDLQNKAASLEKYLSVLEERQLEEMLAVDHAADQHRQAENNLHDLQSQHEELEKQLSEERQSLEQEIEQFHIERQKLVPGITESDLKLYSQLRKSRAGVAVIHTSEQTCGACGTTIPAALYQVARSPSQLAQCSGCKRILHVQ